VTDRVPPAFDVVEARDVSRHYGRRRALARVSFSCQAGAIVWR
jgi:ABC-type multidrug transport system ATPase subunit